MLISLSVTNTQLEFIGSAKVEDLVNRLVQADRAGRHLVVIDRNTVDWIIENTTLSLNVKSHLISIRQSFTTRGAMPSVATSCLVVSPDFQEIRCEDDDGNRFVIGVDEFLRGSFSDFPTAFVLEDIVSDGALYEQALLEARKLTQVPSYRYEAVHSGGSRVPEVFEIEISKSKVVTCLVDSDRISPPDRKSSSALGVLRACSERNSSTRIKPCYIGQALVLPGRELENMVPFHIAKDILSADPDTVKFLSPLILQDSEVATEDCLWLFFDVKRGLDGGKVLDKFERKLISEESLDWLRRHLKVEQAELSTLKLAGWGDSFASSFVKDSEALARFHRFCRGPYWRSVFQPVFSKLLWFFCASRPDRL